MPKGPNGQKRPGDVIGAAIMVAKIATGVVGPWNAFVAAGQLTPCPPLLRSPVSDVSFPGSIESI